MKALKIDDTGLVTLINKNLKIKKTKLEKLNAIKVEKLEKAFKLKNYKSKGFEQKVFVRILFLCDRALEDMKGTIMTEADERIIFQKQGDNLLIEYDSKTVKIKLEEK